MINITEQAYRQIQKLLAKRGQGVGIRLGVRTIDDGFREVLSRVGSANGRQADLSDKLSRR